MTRWIIQFQKLDFHHVIPLVLDHLQFYVHMIFPASDIFISIANAIQTELRHVQDTTNFTKEKILDLRQFIPPK